jgi:hypothetical protein
VNPKCPHCGQEIDLVGPSDLNKDFGINPNALQHAREKGTLPAPWLKMNNRNLWLRADIDEYVVQQGRAKVESTVRDLMKAVSSLPEAERAEAFKLIQQQNPGK